jgi:endonuclease III
MATTTKQRVLNVLLGNDALASEPACDSLPVLEQFVFALCRENASPEQAEQAFANLKSRFFDWNEVRVSSPRELEEALAGLSDAESRAQRLISFLQEVFETTFSFDLEGLQKKGLKQAAKALTRYGASSDYVGAWVVQRSLGGHAIPLDGATLRCARRLGLLDSATEDLEACRASLEHAVPKAKGAPFSDAIAALAERFCWEGEPNCGECPLAGDCPAARELAGAALAGARSARGKPR